MGHSYSTLVQCHGSLPRISSFTWRDLRSKSGGAQTCNLQINVLCSLPGLCQTVTETTVWVNPHNTILRAGGSLMVSKRALWSLSSSKEISDHQPEYNSKMLQRSLITVWKMKKKNKTHPRDDQVYNHVPSFLIEDKHTRNQQHQHCLASPHSSLQL